MCRGFAREGVEALRVTPHVLVLGDINAHLGTSADHAPSDPCAVELLAARPHLAQARMCAAPRTQPNDAGRTLLGVLAEQGLTVTTGRGCGDTGQASCRSKRALQ